MITESARTSLANAVSSEEPNRTTKAKRRRRAQSANEWKPTRLQRLVWMLLRKLEYGYAYTGPVLVEELRELDPPVRTSANVLRTHVLPDMMRFAGVRNQRRIGYYIDQKVTDEVATRKLNARLIGAYQHAPSWYIGRPQPCDGQLRAVASAARRDTKCAATTV